MECHRKVRCGLSRASVLMARRKPRATDWQAALDAEEAFGGPPAWAFTSGWGYFTPHEQEVLARWRQLHDVALRSRVLRDQLAIVR